MPRIATWHGYGVCKHTLQLPGIGSSACTIVSTVSNHIMVTHLYFVLAQISRPEGMVVACAVGSAAQAQLHRCIQQHGQRLSPEGSHPSGCGMLQCSSADQPKPGTWLS